jgi:hypothetical protein
MAMKRIASALLLLAAVSTAQAQVVPKKFQVGLQGGAQKYDESSALENSLQGGLKATYFFTKNLGVGASLMASRPWTKGSYFPYVRYSYLSGDETNDTTLLYNVDQRVTDLQYSAHVTLRHELGHFAPFVTAGIGRYKFFLDPEQNRSLASLTGGLYSLGGGIELIVNENSAVHAALYDVVMSDFDRDAFCMVCSGAFSLMREDRFPNPSPAPPEKKSTVHNPRFSLSFSFVPGEKK